MSDDHDAKDAIGHVTHYFGHLSVAAVALTEAVATGDRIHIRGHTTDLVQDVSSMQVDHAPVDAAKPGDDVAIHVDGHVREHDMIFREA
jgi:putative protease